jgi:hypothetical protein
MQNNCIIFFCILFSLVSTVSAQRTDSVSNYNHSFRISLAGLHYQVKDKLIAPIRWDGPGGSLGFSYLVGCKSLENEFSFLIPVGILSDRYDHRAYAWEASFSYTCLKKIKPSIFSGNLYPGMQIRWDANCQYYADWDDAHLYWLNVYDLGPVLKWIKNHDNRWLTITVHLPIVALISRPSEYQYTDQADLILPSYYFKALHDNLKLTSLNEYISMNIKAEYIKQVSKKTLLGLAWLFNYQTYKEPQNISIISNAFMIHCSFIIGKNKAK